MITSLESANLKIARAEEHFDSIKRSIRDYSLSVPYEIVKLQDGTELLTIKRHPPDEISILAGEIVYQIRSALDHLAFELVTVNPSGVKLPTDWEEHCLFPLWLTPPKRGTAYNCFRRVLPGISETAFALIESWQPYHRQGAANVHRLIAQLSNVDKHRHLNVVLAKVSQHEYVRQSKGYEMSRAQGGLQHGAQIESLLFIDPREAAVRERHFFAYVTFDEPTVGDGAATLEVPNVLDVLLQSMRTFVIPEFEKLLKNPQ